MSIYDYFYYILCQKSTKGILTFRRLTDKLNCILTFYEKRRWTHEIIPLALNHFNSLLHLRLCKGRNLSRSCSISTRQRISFTLREGRPDPWPRLFYRRA